MAPDSGDIEEADDVVSIELGVSRRKLMKQLSAAGLASGLAGMAGCSSLRNQETATPTSGGGGQDGDGGDGGGGGSNQIPEFTRVPLVPPPGADSMDLSEPTHEERRMDFVTHNGTNQFFTPVIAGMNDALNAMGWTGSFTGPEGNDQARQVEILNTKVDSLESGRDLLGTTVLDESSYTAPVKSAMENDITVVQYNTTVDGWDYEYMMDEFGMPLPYVGQRAFPAGNAVGITAYEKAQEILGSDTELTVLPCIAVPGHPALQARTDGFVNSIGAQDNVTMLDQLNVSTDVSQATSRVQDAYSANNDINVILGSGFWGPAAAAQLVESEGLQDEVIVGGFDLPESTLQGIENNTITFTVGQDPYSQGFQSVMLGWEYVERGIPMKDYITGVSIVDESNIEFARTRSGSWDELVSWQDENYDT
ncbi:substrate-binding domain-containing protein [Halosimplex halobium]|uniref:substrate-binding domain-containing protein n=1 Tax=Halosimplex halobium TaxID=3396618 RepID=UPI003F54A52C